MAVWKSCLFFCWYAAMARGEEGRRGHPYYEVVSVENLTCAAPATGGRMWDTLKEILTVLNDLDAPYSLAGATLKYFVVGCGPADDDIDIAIELDWWRKHHWQLDMAMRQSRFLYWYDLGTRKLGPLGYEERWRRGRRKQQNGWLDSGAIVDIFGVQETPEARRKALWVKDADGTPQPHVCPLPRQGYQSFEWGGVRVRAPVPFEPALRSLYGSQWRQPFSGWDSGVHPFTIGSCVMEPSVLQPWGDEWGADITREQTVLGLRLAVALWLAFMLYYWGVGGSYLQQSRVLLGLKP